MTRTTHSHTETHVHAYTFVHTLTRAHMRARIAGELPCAAAASGGATGPH